MGLIPDPYDDLPRSRRNVLLVIAAEGPVTVREIVDLSPHGIKAVRQSSQELREADLVETADYRLPEGETNVGRRQLAFGLTDEGEILADKLAAMLQGEYATV